MERKKVYRPLEPDPISKILVNETTICPTCLILVENRTRIL